MRALARAVLATGLLAMAGVGNARGADPSPPALDLNAATVAQLETLPGVGPKRAQAIVVYRARHGFRRPADLLRIKGFGPRVYARLKSHVRVVRPGKAPKQQKVRASSPDKPAAIKPK